MCQHFIKIATRFGMIALILVMIGLNSPALAQTSPIADCADIYVVQANDWLSVIAEKFLGSIETYPAIVAATNQQHQVDDTFALIANPDAIEVGWKLCVPADSDAETLLIEQAPAVAAPLPAPPPGTIPEVYTLDNFFKQHNFADNVTPAWIYSSPEPVAPGPVSPDTQTIHDTYGARATYWWNENLSDDYFANAGIFKTLPPEIKVFAAPWQSVLPRYRYPPNVTLPSGLTTNGFGWRGSNLSLHKPSNTIRIAAVGASTTVGTHTHAHSYPEFLEHWLNLWSQENGYDVTFEVINAGREGLNSNDIAAVVRYEVLPLDVDYVIYYEGSNQFHPETVVTFPPEYTMGQPPEGVVPNLDEIDSDDKDLLDYLAEHSALASRARSIVEQFLVTGLEPPKPEQTFQLPAGLDEFNPDRRKLGQVLALGRIVDDLDDIKQNLETNNVKMVMTTFNWFAHDGMALDPSRHRGLYIYLNRLYWPISYANINRAAHFQNRVFKKWAATQRVPIIDVAGLIPQHPDLYTDAIHNTYLGTRIRAWLIFEGLVPLLEQDIQNGVLPRPAQKSFAEHPFIKPEYEIRTLSQ